MDDPPLMTIKDNHGKTVLIDGLALLSSICLGLDSDTGHSSSMNWPGIARADQRPIDGQRSKGGWRVCDRPMPKIRACDPPSQPDDPASAANEGSNCHSVRPRPVQPADRHPVSEFGQLHVELLNLKMSGIGGLSPRQRGRDRL